jgi:4-hydroxy-3-methylbut-2-en-1-yl diphosphate synthase IspG/GcpE
LIARSNQLDLLQTALPYVEGVRLVLHAGQVQGEEARQAAESLAQATGTEGKTLWLELDLSDRIADATMGAGETPPLPIELHTPIEALVRLARTSLVKDQMNLILSLCTSHAAVLVRGTRLLAAYLAEAGLSLPIALDAPRGEEPMLQGAAALGSLLCDGVGDLAQAGTVPLAFDLLQGAGARLTRTDYVACPSCGRTLFDLQTTTERIKARTAHLQGVKIAIMGCVVNGPGEMADADFGYMGGSPGHVNLYVGKECVERNVPEGEADERLIALIRAHGRWLEPGTSDE